MHRRPKQHSPTSQISVCPRRAAKMPYKHPQPSSALGAAVPTSNVPGTGVPGKGQSEDEKGFMLQAAEYYFDSCCCRHQHEVSYQGLVLLQYNGISPNMYSYLCAFCPFWQEKVLLIARLVNKEIPRRVFVENIQKFPHSCCEGCSFRG